MGILAHRVLLKVLFVLVDGELPEETRVRCRPARRPCLIRARGGTLVAARPARSRGRVCIRTRLRHGVSARVRAGGAVVGAAWVRTISDADPARGAGGRSAVVSRVRRGRCSLYSLYFTICTRYVISTYVLYLGLNPELSRSAFNGPNCVAAIRFALRGSAVCRLILHTNTHRRTHR